MKKLSMLFALLGVVAIVSGALAVSPANQTGKGKGIIAPHSGDTNPCSGSTLLLNADGSYENGFTWWYGGQVAPYYGAFAEGYSATGTCCGQQWAITTESGMYQGQKADAYILEF